MFGSLCVWLQMMGVWSSQVVFAEQLLSEIMKGQKTEHKEHSHTAVQAKAQ